MRFFFNEWRGSAKKEVLITDPAVKFPLACVFCLLSACASGSGKLMEVVRYTLDADMAKAVDGFLKVVEAQKKAAFGIW
ncbi:MAG: hypothetical protein ACFFCW_14100 [Candidatus Hodarchaeota archaeon]